jgi:hypothetical protein
MRQPDPARALNSARMLGLLIEFFDGGAKWTRGDFHDGDGARCLVGAMQHLRAVHCLSGDPTRGYLLAAMPRNWRFVGLMKYNDHCRAFSELLIVLCRARQLALCDAHGLPKPAAESSHENKAADRLKQMTAAAARWKLIAELARDPNSPAARRITADTYILCPRVPEPRPEPERLAA